MLESSLSRILERLDDDDVVLDIGAWGTAADARRLGHGPDALRDTRPLWLRRPAARALHREDMDPARHLRPRALPLRRRRAGLRHLLAHARGRPRPDLGVQRDDPDREGRLHRGALTAGGAELRLPGAVGGLGPPPLADRVHRRRPRLRVQAPRAPQPRQRPLPVRLRADAHCRRSAWSRSGGRAAFDYGERVFVSAEELDPYLADFVHAPTRPPAAGGLRSRVSRRLRRAGS